MRTSIFRCCLAAICAVSLLFCLAGAPAYAQKAEAEGPFPDDVIVVPQGTEISINDDAGTVTITDSPVEIAEGDTFVVYLQDLPIGYVADSVDRDGSRMVIHAEKADKSIYSQLEEEGTLHLTGDMYDFIPARPKLLSNGEYSESKSMKFQNGTLTVTLMQAGNASVSITFSELDLQHSFTGGDMSVTLSGNWSISLMAEGLLGEVELGSIRVYGVGKIALVLDLTASLECSYSGTFSAGFVGNKLVKSFTCGGTAVTGTITLGLKLTAGIDVLVAEADIFAEIGFKTQVRNETHTHSEAEPPYTVSCTDYKIYAFLDVGAEAKYMNGMGQMVNLAKSGFALMNENGSPFMANVHFENGQLVGGCTEGMDTTSLDPDYYGAGATSAFDSSLLSGSRNRILETSVDLPWDIVTAGDYEIDNGTLNLAGHTLEVNGDLIQAGGTLDIGGGTLIVHGDYRIQSMENGAYGDSTGSLRMNEGSIILDGSLILQTSSGPQEIRGGSVSIGRNIIQKNPTQGSSRFSFTEYCQVILAEKNEHELIFADAANNSIGWLEFRNNTVSQGNVKIGVIEPITDSSFDGFSLTVNGNMIMTGDIDLNGGELTVNGNLYQQDGEMFINAGKLNVSGSYCIAGEGSNYASQIYKDSFGTLLMHDERDEIHIGADFVTASRENSWDDLSAGVMYVGGNFRTVGAQNIYAFRASDSNKVVFNGTGTQTIQFGHVDCGFAEVEFQNPNIELKGNYLRGFTLNEDLNLTLSTNSLTMDGEMDLNGHTLGFDTIDKNFTVNGGSLNLSGLNLTINGNLNTSNSLNLYGAALTVNGNMTHASDANNVAGTLDLNGGSLTVTGNLYQQAGSIYLDGGILDVGGSYCQAGEGSNYTSQIYKDTDATIQMNDDRDELRIGADFVTTSNSNAWSAFSAGVMYVGGNFRVGGTGNIHAFDAVGSHKVIFNGTGTQTIQFNNGTSGFAEVEFQNPNIELKGNYLRGFTLNEDLNLTLSTNSITLEGEMDLNGHSLGFDTIDKNLTVKGRALHLSGNNLTINGNLNVSSSLNLHGAALTVNGNLTYAYDADYGTGTLDLNGGTLTVTGNLYQQDGIIFLDGGKLDVSGSYYLAGEGSNYTSKVYKSTPGVIQMNDARDKIYIGADFVTASSENSPYNDYSAGRMYVKGNFLETAEGHFQARDSHTVVLNGDTEQSVSLLNSGTFATLEITEPIVNYTFVSPHWDRLLGLEFGEASFSLPSDLTEIEEYAFEGIAAASVSVPESCTRIGTGAFRNSAVVQIRIPAGCTIDNEVFKGCGTVFIFGQAGSEAESYCTWSGNENCLFVEE